LNELQTIVVVSTGLIRYQILNRQYVSCISYTGPVVYIRHISDIYIYIR